MSYDLPFLQGGMIYSLVMVINSHRKDLLQTHAPVQTKLFNL